MEVEHPKGDEGNVQQSNEGINKSTDQVEIKSENATIHEVKPSDTLYSVARQYGVTIKELMEWNDKKDFSLSVGEKLKVRSH